MKIDLYEAIGGGSKISAAVALFYQKVLADPSLREFFAKSNMNGLQAKQAMFLSMLIGGEPRYTGRDVGEAHADSRILGLTDAHFNSFLGHLRATLEEVGVESTAVAQILEKLETTRNSILGR